MNMIISYRILLLRNSSHIWSLYLLHRLILNNLSCLIICLIGRCRQISFVSFICFIGGIRSISLSWFNGLICLVGDATLGVWLWYLWLARGRVDTLGVTNVEIWLVTHSVRVIGHHCFMLLSQMPLILSLTHESSACVLLLLIGRCSKGHRTHWLLYVWSLDNILLLHLLILLKLLELLELNELLVLIWGDEWICLLRSGWRSDRCGQRGCNWCCQRVLIWRLGHILLNIIWTLPQKTLLWFLKSIVSLRNLLNLLLLL